MAVQSEREAWELLATWCEQIKPPIYKTDSGDIVAFGPYRHYGLCHTIMTARSQDIIPHDIAADMLDKIEAMLAEIDAAMLFESTRKGHQQRAELCRRFARELELQECEVPSA